MKMDQCIAIIGGGPTGIGVARELAGAWLQVQIYEAESDFGGVWNSGAACGRTYDSLHLISPKFNTQVADFPMPEDYPPYPNHRLMLRYIRDHAKAHGVYGRTHFNAPVQKLEPISGGSELGPAERGVAEWCPDRPSAGTVFFLQFHDRLSSG